MTKSKLEKCHWVKTYLTSDLPSCFPLRLLHGYQTACVHMAPEDRWGPLLLLPEITTLLVCVCVARSNYVCHKRFCLYELIIHIYVYINSKKTPTPVETCSSGFSKIIGRSLLYCLHVLVSFIIRCIISLLDCRSFMRTQKVSVFAL